MAEEEFSGLICSLNLLLVLLAIIAKSKGIFQKLTAISFGFVILVNAVFRFPLAWVWKVSMVSLTAPCDLGADQQLATG